MLTFLEEPSELGLLEGAYVRPGKGSFRVVLGFERAFRESELASLGGDRELEMAFLELDPSFWEAFRVILGQTFPEQIRG